MLSPAERDELNTLQRLGLGKSTRMACCARLKGGAVAVSLTPEPGDGAGQTTRQYDRSIVSVAVIGNGNAGVTAADFIRRGHPDCEIHLVGQESHPLYNRWAYHAWSTVARRCRASTCCPSGGTTTMA